MSFTELPQHWEVKKLGDVCQITTGKWDANHSVENGKYRFYTCAYDYLFCDTSRFSGECIIFPGNGANVGEVFFYNGQFDAYQRTYVIHNIKVLPKYLYYHLKLYWKKGTDTRQYGSATNYIRIGNFLDYKLHFPQLPEQQRIVAKLEELFSELDAGLASLKTAAQQLKTYRQAVLKWAFEGKLTNNHVTEGELPAGWNWVQSGELFDFVTSGSRGWAKYYSDTGAIFVRITNLDFDSLDLDLDLEKIQYVSPPDNSEGLRTKINEGDFLFSITGYLGMFAIAPKLEDAFVNQHIALCRPKEGFNKKFVGYWVISQSGGIHYLNLMRKGAVKAGLGLDDIKGFPVPICSLEEQHRIVQEIESRLSVCEKLEETLAASLRQAEALRQSILKQAFAGKLLGEAE